MPRYRYHFETDSWHEVDKYPASSQQPRIYIHQDTMNQPLEHPCDGRMYDSKSEYNRTTKAHGCVEIGSKERRKPQEYQPVGIKDDILRVMGKR